MNYCITTQNVCDHLQVRNKSKTKTQYIKSKSKISFCYFWNLILEKEIHHRRNSTLQNYNFHLTP